MTKVLDGVVDGVKINEKPINKIRYTDDSRKYLTIPEEYGLTLNIKKKKLPPF